MSLPVAVPAIALPDNSGYVAAAYIVFAALLLIYLSIMAIKLARIEKETAELVALSDAQQQPEPDPVKTT